MSGKQSDKLSTGEFERGKLKLRLDAIIICMNPMCVWMMLVVATGL